MQRTWQFLSRGAGVLAIALVSIGFGATGCIGPNAAAQIEKAGEVFNEARWEFASCHAPYEFKSAEQYLVAAEEELAEYDAPNAHRLAVIAEKRGRDAIAKNAEAVEAGKGHCAPYHEHGG